MIATFSCPKGHNSTEADYCSECGTRITPNSPLENAISQNINSPQNREEKLEICPECTSPHEADSGNFCEICGYNFLTGIRGGLPFINSSLPMPQEVSKPTEIKENEQEEKDNFPSSLTSASTWEVSLLVDSLPHDSLSPPPPKEQLSLSIKLDKSVNLIGRTSQVRAIFPEIPLDFDDAVSHRHALLTCQANGTLILRDIGSSNGTILKGIEIKPMVDIPLEDGDEFTLGHWSRIIVKRLSGDSL